MNFNLKDCVKLATKGFKPSDIAELSALDDNKFDKDDILTLVGNGYKLSDIKDLVKTFDTSEDVSTVGGPEDDNKNSQDKPQQPEKPDNESDHSDADAGDNIIDYKQMYEKEKQLREKLQQTNQRTIEGDKTDSKSDWDIALEIAQDII